MTDNSPCVRVMHDLVDDLDRYSETFLHAFKPNSEDVPAIRAWINDEFYREVVERIAPHFDGNEEVNVMGVGTAEGSSDVLFIDKLRQRFSKVRYTVVEPGPAIKDFKRVVAGDTHVNDVTFDWHNVTLENYCQRSLPTCKGHFSFISMVHAAYYLTDLTNSLSSLMDLLADKGILLIIVNSDDNILVRFLQGLSWKKKNTQARLTHHISEFAEARNVPLVTVNLPARINVTSCFDESSEEGSKLLDFLVEIAYFRETAPQRVYQETMERMRALATDGSDGKQYFITNCRVMILCKT